MYLFIDTETTGLPRNWKAPVTDVNNWPRLVQVAYISSDKNGKVIDSGDYIIKPNGFSISNEAASIHRITNDRALNEGVDLGNVLSSLAGLIEASEILVAHNMSFDEKILGAEFLRAKMTNLFQTKHKICTMEESTSFCQIPGKYGYKWPKLSELHHKLFGVYFDEAHDASVDIEATFKCFWELKRLGEI